MGSFIDIHSSDAHSLQCWRVLASGAPRGAVVVLQEIFGVNHHIQSLCKRLAAAGYDAYAPALFDRLERGFACGYGPEEVANALRFLPRLDWDGMVTDTLATVAEARRRNVPVAVMGFCLGASVGYMAAQRATGIAAVVGYYGGQIAQHLETPPHSPTLLHYGANDHTIPMESVERIRAQRPECELHVYAAGHGFNCDERAAFEPASAGLAWERSMDWLLTHMG
ncbi:dienelactone hydrolase family protein [Variovorax sp. YR216]|uniref:dienelactone hydrolase family protein n=1 Tax=Variovorax sp. YR216 TaxID=1882828 RepID=UPI0008971156|nr:dienelactone hydrolase family protein [Variovorax sp. YR216]SEB14563.1 carboxymethylenebutenolidase [Variovorax sp. YR216]